MTEPLEHPPGTPSWADLTASDPEAAISFYGGLLGWEAVAVEGPEAAGGYRLLTLGGRRAAGVLGSDRPSAWTTYVSVASADEAAERVRAGGGHVDRGPVDIVDAGRMALFTDPVGAVLAVWQPGAHRGAEVVNRLGALCWAELACGDPEAAAGFYGEVFGWAAATRACDGGTCTAWRLGGRVVAGMVVADARDTADAPDAAARWTPYFAVADCDAAARRAEELGGAVAAPPRAVAPGRFPAAARFSVLADPEGAVFSVMAVAGAAS